ncbi:MAG: hypothetical protein JWP91_3607 [Fibrobacteres bacterium]|nr:hypothetical protein [Fibrobacterota bacterium]
MAQAVNPEGLARAQNPGKVSRMESMIKPGLPSAPFAFAIFVSSALALTACKEKVPGASGSSASESQAAGLTVPSKPPVEGELVITARLMEIPGAFPANELYNYAYVMKYKVLKVIQGTYADSEILVGHYNPRLAREEIKDEQDAKVGGNVKSFQVGDAHYLVLSPLDGVFTGAVEDDYFKDKRPRYWALWAEKAQ